MPLRMQLHCFVSFNPRAHVGRDPNMLLFNILTCGFNPRAHVGRDKMIMKYMII